MHVDKDDPEDAHVFVFDQRFDKTPCQKIHIGGIFSFVEFYDTILERFCIEKENDIIITTTNRSVINEDTYLQLIESGDTLYILNSIDQKLLGPVLEKIDFQPHYDTLIKSGVYEYYASEGNTNPLPFAFAELIDNALAATAKNTGSRNISLNMFFDDTLSQYVMSVQDNGVGMTPRQLNNWAVYRLSKFNRKDRHNIKDNLFEDRYEQDESTISKSLNSDISWFGVGGKQAIFFIGNAVRVITRSKGEYDVHEFTLSKDDFKQKEANKEKIYSGYIKNRSSSDNTHIPKMEKVTQDLIIKEKYLPNNSGFTNIIISGIDAQHIPYIRHGFNKWTRQLAHIYHYYIHGTEGNTAMSKQRKNIGATDVNIFVTMYEQGVEVESVSLRDIEDDQETQFIRTACDTFEFEISNQENAKIEGIMRYHPFLYDKETYPIIDNNVNDSDEESIPDDSNYQTRGQKPIFQCFWNGRLIPYTFVQDFDWCRSPRKRGLLPTECYERISGCLFTNDKFRVSTNKLTFIDLDAKLKDSEVHFYRVILGEKQSCNLQKQFFEWLKECHEKYDKQIKFLNYIDHILHATSRQPRMLWTSFEAIEWEGKLYKTGQLVRTCRTTSPMFGRIQRFLLLGQHEGDTFAVGGEVEIVREPLMFYGEIFHIPLSKLDRNASKATIQNQIKNESSNMPTKIKIKWKDSNKIEDKSKIQAGSDIGEMIIEVITNKGESVDKLLTNSGSRKLLVEQKIYMLCAANSGRKPSKPREIASHVSSFPYVFESVNNIHTMGDYLIDLQVLFANTGSSTLGDGKELPSRSINFSVTEAPPCKFMVGVLESPLCVGKPFDLPLDLQDEHNHPTKAIQCEKPILKSSGLDLSYDDYIIKDNSIIIKKVVALGEVPSQIGQNFSMTVTIPNLKQKTQTMKIRLLPGAPKELRIQSISCNDVEVEMNEMDKYPIENHCKLAMEVALVDIALNPTMPGKGKLQAKFSGSNGLPTITCEIKKSSMIANLSGKFNIKKLRKNLSIKGKISLVGRRDISPVDLHLLVQPSVEPYLICVYYQDPYSEGESTMKLKSGQDIFWHAGEAICNLTFELFDEAMRKVDITEQISELIKVNWISESEISDLSLKQGDLPDVVVPLNTKDSKFCQIVYSGTSNTSNKSVQFSFYVKPVAGEPETLKCEVVGGRETEIGVMRTSPILVSICDKHHNKLLIRDTQLNNIKISCPGLDIALISKMKEEHKIVISNIQFNEGPLGSKDVTIEYKSGDIHIKDHCLLELIPGTPVMMEVLGWPSFSQPVVIASGSKVPDNIQIQLLDGWGNKSFQKGVRVVMSKDQGIKISPTLSPLVTNGEGYAKFSKFSVFGKRGEYSIQPRAVFNRTSIEGPKLKLSVLPNTETPVTLKVQFDKEIKSVHAGSFWPEFKVKVLTEEGECVAAPVHLCMAIWKCSGKKDRCIPGNAELHRIYLIEPDIALFENIEAPKTPGMYSICFRLTDSETSHNTLLISPYYKYEIVAALPHCLSPATNPGTPTVSNAKAIANRTLIRNLKLKLKDKYDNTCSHEYCGTVKLTIELATESLKSNAIPLFEGKCKTLIIPLRNSSATLQNICIKENSPGTDATEYCLRCEVTSPQIPEPLPPYNLCFMFYNDVNTQIQMAALSKQSDSLKKDIESYESLFSLHQTLIDELKKTKSNLEKKKADIIKDIRKTNLSLSNKLDIEDIKELINESISEQNKLALKPRRKCNIKEYPDKGPDILGKIGHLACVEDEDLAKVLSWHMMGDLDCLVTLTTKKAREVYSCTGGMQQVLPFDSIYKKNIDENRPLPHKRMAEKCDSPSGNPLYAKDALIFPKSPETCKVIFGMLIGDTIIMDDLESANEYRKKVVKYTYCPTILTRNGERIRSNGKFGGSQNKIYSIDQLKGCVFGEPVHSEHKKYSSRINLLRQLKNLLIEYNNACDELECQKQTLQTSEMLQKRKEHQDAVNKLKEFEKKIGMKSSSNDKAMNNSRKHQTDQIPQDVRPKKKTRLK